MYNIVNLSESIYLYNVSNDIVTHEFLSLYDLLKFLAINDYNDVYRNKSKYLGNINMGKDVEKLYEYIPVAQSDDDSCVIKQKTYPCGVYCKKYMFYDGLGRIIDPRHYEKEIEKIRLDIAWKRCDNKVNYIRYVYSFNESILAKKPYYSWKPKQRENSLPEYRVDPIPHIGRRRFCNYYRHFATFNERRQNADPEVFEYVRPSRRYDSWELNPYDNERVRPWRNKSWKDCTKKRKQWM